MKPKRRRPLFTAGLVGAGAGVAVGAEAAPVLGMADSMVKAGSGLPSALSRLKNRVCSQAGRQLSIDISSPNTNIGPIQGQFLPAYWKAFTSCWPANSGVTFS